MTKSEQLKAEYLALVPDGPDPLVQVDQVIRFARENPASAWHSELEWDDVKAGEEHRRWQVRCLINLHVVTIERKPVMVSLSLDRAKPGGGYRRMEDVIASPDLTDVMMDDAIAELERVFAKYSMLAALAGVWQELDLAKRKRSKAKAA